MCPLEECVGSRAGTASVPAGQGKLADVGSNTDVAQERSRHWCQNLLIALSLGPAFSQHSPATALAGGKDPARLPFCGTFFPRGKAWLGFEVRLSGKRLWCCAQFSSWAAL